MRIFLLCLLVVAAVAAHAGWVAPGAKTEPPEVSWPGRIPAADSRGIDVLRYELTIDLVALPPQTPWIEGTAVVRVRYLDPAPDVLRLDLVDDLTVSEVRRGLSSTPFIQTGDSLTVNVPLASPGNRETFTITYAGSPPRHGPLYAGLLLRQRDNAGPPTVGNVSQPYSSHGWFPCKDHPGDKATLAMTVTAADTLTVSATGRLLGTDDLPGGRRTWRWDSEFPVATYLVGLLVSEYETWSEDCVGFPLVFHAFSEHVDAARVTYAPTCDMMKWLEDLAGPFPFIGEKYAQAEFAWGGAMENQTVTAFGQASLTLPERSAHLVTVHELAHHWFGNSLTPRDWRDIWLNEGFARYVELLWREHTEGAEAYRDYLHLLNRDDLFVGDGLLGDPDPVLPNSMVYDKGAWVVHMLRLHVGDAAFFRFLHDYATDHDLTYQHTDRQAMTDAASIAAGEDLAPFFAPWLDTEAVPELGLRWRPLAADDRRILVEVVQHQESPFFPLTVPVRVHAGLEVVDLKLRMDDRIAGIEVATTAPVDSVLLDPDDLVLNRTALTPAPRILAAQPRPNPSVGATHLSFWLAGADRVSADVYDMGGRLVYRADLGALPATGEGAPHVWTWQGNGRDDRRAPAGVYWLVLYTSDDRTVRKATLVR